MAQLLVLFLTVYYVCYVFDDFPVLCTLSLCTIHILIPNY
jgi:hypothetical protein